MWCTPWLRGRGGESTSPRISIPSATIFLHDTLFSIPRSLDLPVYLGRISHLQNFLITFSSLIPSLDNRTKNNNRRACSSERLAQRNEREEGINLKFLERPSVTFRRGGFERDESKKDVGEGGVWDRMGVGGVNGRGS